MLTFESTQVAMMKRFPSVLTLGKFDGVHRGHQKLIDRTISEARRLGALSVVIVFEKHSAAGGQASPITPFNAKTRLIRSRGVDAMIRVGPDSEWLRMEPAAFIQDVLLEGLGMVKIVTGPDFRFGHHRLGGTDMLRRVGDEMGFDVETISFVHAGERRISSSYIRSLLGSGEFGEAARMLSREPILAG